MTTPHPQAELLRAIADGKQMQRHSNDEWLNCTAEAALNRLALGMSLRIKPDTITVNGVEVPKPLGHPFDGGKWIISIQLGEHKSTACNGEVIICKDYTDARTVFDALILPFKSEGV